MVLNTPNPLVRSIVRGWGVFVIRGKGLCVGLAGAPPVCKATYDFRGICKLFSSLDKEFGRSEDERLGKHHSLTLRTTTTTTIATPWNMKRVSL